MQTDEEQKENNKAMGNYPYEWIKHFYSKGSGYESEPHNANGESVVDETLIEVKGSELNKFLAQQRERVLRELLKEENLRHANLFDQLKKHQDYPKYDNYSISYLAGKVRESTLRGRELREKIDLLK